MVIVVTNLNLRVVRILTPVKKSYSLGDDESQDTVGSDQKLLPWREVSCDWWIAGHNIRL